MKVTWEGEINLYYLLWVTGVERKPSSSAFPLNHVPLLIPVTDDSELCSHLTRSMGCFRQQEMTFAALAKHWQILCQTPHEKNAVTVKDMPSTITFKIPISLSFLFIFSFLKLKITDTWGSSWFSLLLWGLFILQDEMQKCEYTNG